MNFAHTIAVITGAGRGIGRAIALALAEQGAQVVVAARSPDEIAETAWLIGEIGQRAHARPVDVQSRESVEDLAAWTLHTLGTPHILVNSAGVGLRAPLEETTDAQWDAVHATLLRGTYLVIRAFLPAMKAQRQGSIINIGAPLDKLAMSGFTAYCAAKYGVEGLTRALARELRPHGIAVNALHPGGFADTRLLRATAPEAASKPGKLLPPDSVAAAALFLAAQGPRGTTGSVLDAQAWSQPATPAAQGAN